MEESIEYLKKEHNASSLNEIKNLIIDEEIDPYEDYNFLSQLTNLESLIFKNSYITISIINNINNLNNLKSLSFYNSEFSTEFELTLPLSKLVLNNVKNFSYNILDNPHIKELYLDNMGEINLKNLINLENYKTLSFENTKLTNQEYLFYLNNITKLDLFNTATKDLSLLLSFSDLKILVIDKTIALNNKEYILKLIDSGTTVVDNLNRKVTIYYER